MIFLKNSEQIELIKKAGTITADCLSFLSLQVKPGVTGLQLDKMAEEFIRSQGGIPATIGYHGYEHSICCSINHQAVHCPPTNLSIKEGDVVKIDLVVNYKDWNADSAITVLVPPVKDEVRKLAETTYLALWEGIEQAVEGKTVLDISQAIFNAKNGLSVIKEFCGHGIGQEIHELPQIPNYPAKDKNILLVAGMVLCIEPIFSLGKPDLYIKQGDWNTWALDSSKVAHFEHTLVVNPAPNPPTVLTLRQNEQINIF